MGSWLFGLAMELVHTPDIHNTGTGTAETDPFGFGTNLIRTCDKACHYHSM